LLIIAAHQSAVLLIDTLTPSSKPNAAGAANPAGAEIVALLRELVYYAKPKEVRSGMEEGAAPDAEPQTAATLAADAQKALQVLRELEQTKSPAKAREIYGKGAS